MGNASNSSAKGSAITGNGAGGAGKTAGRNTAAPSKHAQVRRVSASTTHAGVNQSRHDALCQAMDFLALIQDDLANLQRLPLSAEILVGALPNEGAIAFKIRLDGHVLDMTINGEITLDGVPVTDGGVTGTSGAVTGSITGITGTEIIR